MEQEQILTRKTISFFPWEEVLGRKKGEGSTGPGKTFAWLGWAFGLSEGSPRVGFGELLEFQNYFEHRGRTRRQEGGGPHRWQNGTNLRFSSQFFFPRKPQGFFCKKDGRQILPMRKNDPME
jgi:hypothetical protein